MNLDFQKWIDEELKVALGCTEPIAVALAASWAKKHAEIVSVQRIEVHASVAVFKNAMAVKIPGTQDAGIAIASVLGAFYGNSDRNLKVLEDINVSNIHEDRIFSKNHCKLHVVPNAPSLYIDVQVWGFGQNNKERRGQAVIVDKHDNLYHLAKDEEPLAAIPSTKESNVTVDELFNQEALGQLLDFIQHLPEVTRPKLKETITLNHAICSYGLANKNGLQVGQTLHFHLNRQLHTCPIEELTQIASAYTAAGSDARMAGCTLPVMSLSGSGNQGITATAPIIKIAQLRELTEEKMEEGLALSVLITIMVKKVLGRLSPLCGVLNAGIGVAAAIVYLENGNFEQIVGAMQNVLGSATGMLCDGAKAGCAMKVATGVFCAVQAAALALKEQVISEQEGIICRDFVNTMKNMQRLSKEGMSDMDQLILELMLHKC